MKNSYNIQFCGQSLGEQSGSTGLRSFKRVENVSTCTESQEMRTFNKSFYRKQLGILAHILKFVSDMRPEGQEEWVSH